LIELDNNLLIKDTFGWDIALFIQLIEPKTMNQRNDILTQLLFFGGTQFFCVLILWFLGEAVLVI
jgi:hypothetical protein